MRPKRRALWIGVLGVLGAQLLVAQESKMERSSGSVEANGLTFHYLEVGEGPLVLALHGFPDHARSFRHQMPVLAEAGYRVVAPYLRGYAPTDSPSPDEAPYQVAALAQDAAALLEAFEAEDAILIGHDWGAAAAYGAARLVPDRIRRLITIAVPYGGQFTESLVINPAQQRRSWYMFFFQMAFAEMAVAYDDLAFIDRLWQEWSPGWDYPADEMAALKQTLSKPGVLTAALSYYRHSFNPQLSPDGLDDVAARLEGPISVPTLYIHGIKDGCIGAELTEGMAALFPSGLELQILDDAGHFVHQERPEEVNRLILDFVGSAAD